MGLLKFLKDNDNTRKIFGERELKIIEKQLFGVNLTQSEKNRLSRDIRKKFEFIRDVAGFREDFRIKKGTEIDRMIQEAKDVILEDASRKSVENIILYGSAADNALTLRSDIDIAVRFDNITLQEATLFRKRISGKVNQRIDVQVYNVLPDKVKKEIDGKGVRILCE